MAAKSPLRYATVLKMIFFQKHIFPVKIQSEKCLTLNVFIVSLAWKCDETNSKLLLRKIFFEIFLVQSDVMDS